MKILLILSSLLVITIAPFYGQVEMDISKIADSSSMEHQIFWELRFPRMVVAFFAGALLGLAGLLFQSLFKNPMGTPYTLGVASGSTLGAAFAIIFGLGAMVSLFGFLGAIVTIMLLFALTSRLKSFESNSLLLVGIALSFFYNAVIMILFYISDESQSFEIVRFTMGSLDVAGWSQTILIALSAMVLLAVAPQYNYELRLLLTSNENAFLKGIEVKKVNIVLLLVISVAVGLFYQPSDFVVETFDRGRCPAARGPVSEYTFYMSADGFGHSLQFRDVGCVRHAAPIGEHMLGVIKIQSQSIDASQFLLHHAGHADLSDR
jgi:iron complex transport system permease protein